jgi:hypothetical protein
MEEQLNFPNQQNTPIMKKMFDNVVPVYWGWGLIRA